MDRHTASFEREVFTLPRELEYFTADELEKQTGYTREMWWPRVIVKETIDNALDACEQTELAPEITVKFEGQKLEICDNGGGIRPEIVTRLVDYATRTSDKLAYVSPTRGAQGNAWKTIFAMPYVLDGERARPVTIEACGVRHQIHVGADQVQRRPRIDYQRQELSVKTCGTAIVLERDQACLEEEDDPDFLPRLIFDYSLFNPHATFRLDPDIFSARDAGWTKWSPRDPTPPHWYTPERFEELVASYVATGTRMTVRDFLATFRGLKGTRSRMQVLSDAALPRSMRLEELADRKRGTFDQHALRRLLTAMRDASQPPLPQLLGVLGKECLLAQLKGTCSSHITVSENQSFRYAKQIGWDHDLPFVVEAAFCLTEDELRQGLHVGLNWSVALTNPLQDCRLPLADGTGTFGLEGLLRHQRVDHEDDPVSLVLHIAMPRFEFLDRGKGSVELSPPVAQAVADMVSKVIREWASIKRSRDREHHRAARRAEELLRHGRTQDHGPRRRLVGDGRRLPQGFRAARSPPALARSCMRPGAEFSKSPDGPRWMTTTSPRCCFRSISGSTRRKPPTGT
jgi:DNA topoisomerase VI subunit B